MWRYTGLSATGSDYVNLFSSSGIQYVCIYYHCSYGGAYESLKLRMGNGDTRGAALRSFSHNGSSQQVIMTEPISVSISGSRLTVSRYGAFRAVITPTEGEARFNPSPGTLFYIDEVVTCQ